MHHLSGLPWKSEGVSGSYIVISPRNRREFMEKAHPSTKRWIISLEERYDSP